MNEELPRRRFRFGLISLFLLVAAVGVLACFWNPLVQPDKSNLGKIKTGMTEADVAALVGEPDSAETVKGVLIQWYQVADRDGWVISFKDGLVNFTGSPRATQPSELRGPINVRYHESVKTLSLYPIE
jgi:hypothetical protein